MGKNLKKKGKHFKILKRRYKFIIFLLSIIIIIAVAYIIRNLKDKEEVQEESKLLNTIEIEETEVTENKTERMLQVEKLRQENSDIVGWVEIEGTNINYPVLQGDDNSYYMTHNYKKEKILMALFF